MLDSSLLTLSLMDRKIVKIGIKQLHKDLNDNSCDFKQSQSNLSKLGIGAKEMTALMDLYGEMIGMNLPYGRLWKD